MKINSRKRGRPVKIKSKLEKQVIIRTARELTLNDGKIPSIRHLAAKLDVDPMAVYHYFSNKQTLLEAVSISLISDLYMPVKDFSWKDNLMNLCKSYLSLLITYPDLIKIILSVSSGSAASVFIERFNMCTRKLNLSQAYIKTVSDLLADYIHGFAYAASCNKSENKITIRMSEDPLNLIFENIRMNSEQTFSN